LHARAVQAYATRAVKLMVNLQMVACLAMILGSFSLPKLAQLPCLTDINSSLANSFCTKCNVNLDIHTFGVSACFPWAEEPYEYATIAYMLMRVCVHFLCRTRATTITVRPAIPVHRLRLKKRITV